MLLPSCIPEQLRLNLESEKSESIGTPKSNSQASQPATRFFDHQNAIEKDRRKSRFNISLMNRADRRGSTSSNFSIHKVQSPAMQNGKIPQSRGSSIFGKLDSKSILDNADSKLVRIKEEQLRRPRKSKSKNEIMNTLANFNIPIKSPEPICEEKARTPVLKKKKKIKYRMIRRKPTHKVNHFDNKFTIHNIRRKFDISRMNSSPKHKTKFRMTSL